jgi:hypothetical protein
MTIEQLRAVYKAQPFQPFTLHLADGEKLHVPHPDYFSHAPNGRTLIVYGSGREFSIVDLLLVTRLEVNNGAATESPNGN